MRVAIVIALLAGCGDNKRPATQASDAGTDASALAPCLERPDQLATPPTGALPCELLPPGFTAP
jgi:hypothetical protein